jgi:hypothetical protein
MSAHYISSIKPIFALAICNSTNAGHIKSRFTRCAVSAIHTRSASNRAFIANSIFFEVSSRTRIALNAVCEDLGLWIAVSTSVLIVDVYCLAN